MRKTSAFTLAVVCGFGLVTAGASYGQDSTTSSTPNNLGFQVDSIADSSGSISFSDQFEAGVSTVETEHKVNLAECPEYNNESALETLSGALSGEDRDAGSTDDSDASDEESDVSDEESDATELEADAGAEDPEDSDATELDVEEAVDGSSGASCGGICGGTSADGTCFCDGDCEEFGDCCEDFCDACPDLGSCAGESGSESGTESSTEGSESATDEGGESDITTPSIECDLGAAPMIDISWSVDSTLVDYGYKWTAKVGSCGSGTLTDSSDSCRLLTDSAQTLLSSGNTFEVPLAKLIGTLDETDDEEVAARECCEGREGYSGSTNIYVFIGSDNGASTDVEYDLLSFKFDYAAPSAPSDITVEELGETLSVSWERPSGESDDTTYSVYYSTSDFDSLEDASSVSAGDDTSVTLTELSLGSDYYIRVGAVDDFGNVSVLSETVMGSPRETYDGWESYKTAGGKEEGGCFIATAAFGSYVEPHVMVLRQLRDNVLMRYSWGRDFVAFYYEEGPQWAAFIADREWAKGLVRVSLMPLVGLSMVLIQLSPLGQVAFLSMLMLLMGALALGMMRMKERVAVRMNGKGS